MALYSEKVMDHFENPRNVGKMPDADGIGEVGNAKCGDIMRMYIKVNDGIISDVKFNTFGCGSAIASSSMATEMIKGKPISEALALSNKAVVEALDGLPAQKIHCSVLAEEAVKAAVKDYYDKNGIDLPLVKQLKEVERKRIREYVTVRPEAEYHEGCSGVWQIPCDIALPCATQNELDLESAKALIKNGCFAVAEGANMPCTPDAVEALQAAGLLFAPAKAANAGGVATSALEMSQNSMRMSWSFEEVDNHLKEIMTNLYHNAANAAAQYGKAGDLVSGANIAGFLKVADAMLAYGLV